MRGFVHINVVVDSTNENIGSDITRLARHTTHKKKLSRTAHTQKEERERERERDRAWKFCVERGFDDSTDAHQPTHTQTNTPRP